MLKFYASEVCFNSEFFIKYIKNFWNKLGIVVRTENIYPFLVSLYNLVLRNSFLGLNSCKTFHCTKKVMKIILCRNYTYSRLCSSEYYIIIRNVFFIGNGVNRRVKCWQVKKLVFTKGHFTKVYSNKVCELQNFPGFPWDPPIGFNCKHTVCILSNPITGSQGNSEKFWGSQTLKE